MHPHPKRYISHSQLKQWESDPEEYLRLYVHGGEKRGTNRGMALGKELADALESGEDTGKIELDAVIAMLPKYEIRDKSIMAKLASGKGKDRIHIPILLKPDSVTRDCMRFYEYKQGTTPWTQKKVDEDDQMSFYTAGLHLRARMGGNMLIPRGELFWAVSEKRIDADGVERPHLTGEIKRFPTTRDFGQVIHMHMRIAKAWREIGEAMEAILI